MRNSVCGMGCVGTVHLPPAGRDGELAAVYHGTLARVITVTHSFAIFSVHQDGMAPMALRRVMAVSAEDFAGHIERGLDWLFAANELHASMVCQERKVIWRDIERRYPVSYVSYVRYLTLALARLGLPRLAQAVDRPVLCSVNREMRPYELGWLVHALADQGAPLG